MSTRGETQSQESSAPVEVTHYLVLDFEATCDSDRGSVVSREQEIIEWPVVVVDAVRGQVVDEAEFHSYVKPEAHPQLTAFCTELTGIEQEWVDKAPVFVDVLASLQEHLKAHGLDADDGSVLCVTCGDWDLKSMLPRQWARAGLEAEAMPPLFQRWCNLKNVASHALRTKVHGMTDMLSGLGLELEGRHHSGIDDSRNIARCLCELLKRRVAVGATTDNTVPKDYVERGYTLYVNNGKRKKGKSVKLRVPTRLDLLTQESLAQLVVQKKKKNQGKGGGKVTKDAEEDEEEEEPKTLVGMIKAIAVSSFGNLTHVERLFDGFGNGLDDDEALWAVLNPLGSAVRGKYGGEVFAGSDEVWQPVPDPDIPPEMEIQWVPVLNGAIGLWHRPRRNTVEVLHEHTACRAVLTLLGGNERPEAVEKQVEAYGDMQWLHFPLDHGVPPVPERYEELWGVFDTMRKLLEESKVHILVHCSAGIHRTGMITNAFLRTHAGMDRDQALETLRAMRTVTADEFATSFKDDDGAARARGSFADVFVAAMGVVGE